MKKIILILIALVVFGATVNAQQSYSRVDNKTFKAEKVTKTKASTYTPTGYYYQLKSGEKREIYIHTKTRGEHKGQQACYIKNPKGGWREINVKPEELS